MVRKRGGTLVESLRSFESSTEGTLRFLEEEHSRVCAMVRAGGSDLHLEGSERGKKLQLARLALDHKIVLESKRLGLAREIRLGVEASHHASSSASSGPLPSPSSGDARVRSASTSSAGGNSGNNKKSNSGHGALYATSATSSISSASNDDDGDGDGGGGDGDDGSDVNVVIGGGGAVGKPGLLGRRGIVAGSPGARATISGDGEREIARAAAARAAAAGQEEVPGGEDADPPVSDGSRRGGGRGSGVLTPLVGTMDEFYHLLDADPELVDLQRQVCGYESELLQCHTEYHVDDDDDGAAGVRVPEAVRAGVLNEFVNAHIRDPRTLAHRTAACFILRYISWADGPHAQRVWTRGHRRRCRVPHLPAFTDTAAHDVREFVRLLSSHLAQAYASECLEGIEQVEVAVEDYIFPQIAQRCMDQVLDATGDAAIHAKCSEYAGVVTQSQLFIEPRLQSSESVPFITPITQLRTVSSHYSPSKKLAAIYSAAQSVIATLDKLNEAALVIGADDFLPIWIFVVLHADVGQLASNIAFIRTYGSPQMLQTELGYYFSSLELASEVIKGLGPEKLNKAVAPAPMADRPFLMCERHRARAWTSRDPAVELVSEKETLRGYRLFVVEEWLWDVSRFQSVVAVHTGNPEDRIVFSVVKVDATVSESQQRFLESIFLKSLPQSKMVPEETEYGTLLLCTHQFSQRVRGLEGCGGADGDSNGGSDSGIGTGDEKEDDGAEEDGEGTGDGGGGTSAGTTTAAAAATSKADAKDHPEPSTTMKNSAGGNGIESDNVFSGGTSTPVASTRTSGKSLKSHGGAETATVADSLPPDTPTTALDVAAGSRVRYASDPTALKIHRTPVASVRAAAETMVADAAASDEESGGDENQTAVRNEDGDQDAVGIGNINDGKGKGTGVDEAQGDDDPDLFARPAAMSVDAFTLSAERLATHDALTRRAAAGAAAGPSPLSPFATAGQGAVMGRATADPLSSPATPAPAGYCDSIPMPMTLEEIERANVPIETAERAAGLGRLRREAKKAVAESARRKSTGGGIQGGGGGGDGGDGEKTPAGGRRHASSAVSPTTTMEEDEGTDSEAGTVSTTNTANTTPVAAAIRPSIEDGVASGGDDGRHGDNQPGSSGKDRVNDNDGEDDSGNKSKKRNKHKHANPNPNPKGPCSPPVSISAASSSSSPSRATSTGTTAADTYFDSLTLHWIPSGDIAEHADHIVLQVQLKRVGCGMGPEASGDELVFGYPHDAEARFCEMYRFHIPVASVSLETALRTLVCEVQTALRHLDVLPGRDVLDIDGVYEEATLDAVRRFKQHRAKRMAPSAPPAAVDGTMNPACLSDLRDQVAAFRERLEAAGYRSKDPIRHALAFEATIRAFQSAHGVEQSGRLTRETREMLAAIEADDNDVTI